MLSKSLEQEDPLAPVLAIRKLRHEQLAEQLFLAQKNASIRSGARGLQARKELNAIENRVAASTKLSVAHLSSAFSLLMMIDYKKIPQV